eukprot:701644-Prorocentrum_minimum.AAC.1
MVDMWAKVVCSFAQAQSRLSAGKWQSAGREYTSNIPSVEYSKCRALDGIPVSTVDDCRLLN